MRRSVIFGAAASLSMVLLAMLIPMGLLVRGYALEDRLASAALEVQATESVVAGRSRTAVATYVARINQDTATRTTVLYPDGAMIGPDPGEDARVVDARHSGRARVDDVDDGVQILVPVSRGGNSALPSQTPVIRVIVTTPGLTSPVGRAWLILAAMGMVLLVVSLLLADRLGRSFVAPIRALAAHTRRLGEHDRPEPVTVSGPAEVQDLAAALNRLVERVDLLLRREREAVADLSHRLRTPVTVLRLRVEAISDPIERARFSADLDDLEATVDQIVRDARRSEREGVDPQVEAVAVLRERTAFWAPLAEDQGRPYRMTTDGADEFRVRVSGADLIAVVDAILDNAFSHTPEGTAIWVRLTADATSLVFTVADAGPGLPADLDPSVRGESGVGSTGLGLAIVARTATEAGGSLALGSSAAGGAEVTVTLRR